MTSVVCNFDLNVPRDRNSSFEPAIIKKRQTILSDELDNKILSLIRNTLKYVGSKNSREFMQDLKIVYQAETKDMAEHNLLELDEKWGKKYPMVIKSWQENWEYLSNYFKYSSEIRKLIYTTNPIEGFPNRRLS